MEQFLKLIINQEVVEIWIKVEVEVWLKVEVEIWIKVEVEVWIKVEVEVWIKVEVENESITSIIGYELWKINTILTFVIRTTTKILTFDYIKCLVLEDLEG